MTNTQKERIQRMRWRDCSYIEISEALGVPEATIKSFCRRNNLQDADLQTLKAAREDFAIPVVCTQCGLMLEQGAKRKPRRFCSDKCRLAWWNSHRHEINHKKIRKLICAACGNEFKSYDAGRKYCSHACYIQTRFGGDRLDSRPDGT